MSNQKNRIKMIRVLLEGSVDLGFTAECSIIAGEFENVLSVVKNSKKSNNLLMQVLFSTRALDTSLKTFIREKCNCWGMVDPNDHSLGAYLTWLANDPNGVAILNESERQYYQREIVDRRNKYMHKAGEFPRNKSEINKLLITMENCLAQVLSFSR